MVDLSKFCTCENFGCPLHPTMHDKGCTPCIQKNLAYRQIPECFFNLVENSGSREDSFFEDFAELIINNNEEKQH